MKKLFLLITSLSLLVMLGCESESKSADTKNNKLEYQGSIVAVGEEYTKWNLTPTFKYHTKDQRTGENVSYEIIGKKDSFGITGPFPIIANKSQKYMWFYWGKKPIKDQPVKVMAYKKGSNELIKLFSGEFYEGAQINEKEVNMPSSLKFPDSGIWNVLVFIHDELSGNVVVQVAERG
ncbi:hypothetical protein [Thalassobacillus pellis]|uniref:hypothetical protein n=1 Tax=Thalassobacillus pellis TaxID=748008 RepID=UPI0019610517|nr:hypothetical protein [Thalassobacillus pellis]MBM7553899.1 hypothetical protein [Thalassobacillus pellis]